MSFQLPLPPLSKIIQPPIYSEPPQIDEFFLSQKEGKLIQQAANTLVTKKLVSDVSVEAFFDRMNKKLKTDTSIGEAVAFTHFGRPQFSSVKFSSVEKMIALFHQLIYFIAVEVIPAPVQVGREILDPLESNTFTSLESKGLFLLDDVVIKKGKQNVQEFGAALSEKMKQLFKARAHSDFTMTMKEERATGIHLKTIVLRPDDEKLYDSKFGEVAFSNRKAFDTYTLEYMTRADVSAVVMTAFGPKGK